MSNMNREGIIEKVKRSVTTALLDVFDQEHPDETLRGLTVDSEYPDKRTSYPAIFVQFSIRKLGAADINQTFFDSEGRPFQVWEFEGTVTLSLVALRSRERDRMADAFISTFAFGRQSNSPTNDFYKSLSDSDYINITVSSYTLKPNGQMTNIGTPWDEKAIAYEDSYAFDIMGQFASDPTTQVLRRLDGIRVLGGLTQLEGQEPDSYKTIYEQWI